MLHARAPLDQSAFGLLSGFLDVVAGGEGLAAGAGDDDDADFRVAVGLADGVHDLVDERQA